MKFNKYMPRKIQFEKIEEVGDWKVKVYSITNNKVFESIKVLENSIKEIPNWLEHSKALRLPTYSVATLIVHEGGDGVWSLINWWIGGDMMQNITYFTSYDSDKFETLPCDGSIACVWELSVICHERIAWIKHILKNPDSPKFDDYLADVIEGLV